MLNKDDVLTKMEAAAKLLAATPYAHLVSAVVMGMDLIKEQSKMAAQDNEVSRGDWVEDFEHENGQYECRCIMCNRSFVGHKRRVICKICH